MMPLPEQFHGLFNDWPRAVALFNRKGQIELANTAFAELYETTRDDLVGQTVWDVVGLQADLTIVKRAWKDIESGTPCPSIDWATSTPSGRTMWLSGKVSAFSGSGLAAFAIDDKTNEKELSAQVQEHLVEDEALIASLPVTMLRVDYQGSLVRLCDNAAVFAEGAVVEGFLWTMALPPGMGEAICDAMRTANLEQRAMRLRHSHTDRHYELVVTPCGMSDTLVLMHDVTDSVLLDRAKRASIDRMQMLVEGSDNVLFLLDNNLCVSYASPAVQSALGRTPSEIQGHPLTKFAADTDALRAAVEFAMIEEAGRLRGMYDFLTPAGRLKHLQLDIVNYLNEPLINAVVVNCHDVTRLVSLQQELTVRMQQVEEMNAALARQATTDSMTGLHNHMSFQHHFDQAAELAAREGAPLSILMVDIDYFKSVNDKYGHLVGDKVLGMVAGRLKATCRKSDVVARYGGEEFAVLLPNTDGAGAYTTAEAIRKAVADEDFDGLDLTVSIGLATAEPGCSNVREILSQADSALYESKHSGRDQVTAYRPGDQAA